jgi:hypothetical protein|tara:strand:+ start:595 stop:957 length:363 start_codon:yes stop_codon:yes gene_type:complete
MEEKLSPPGSKVMKETDPSAFPTPLELDDIENMLDNIIYKHGLEENIPGLPGINPYTIGSKYHTVFEMLNEGTTLDDIERVTKTNRKNAATYVSYIKRKIKNWGTIEKMEDGTQIIKERL